MLHNYLTITLRNLGRHPGYAVINVLGLATGLATCILIGMFVRYELSVDAWHEKGDRIYRVIRETRSDGDPEFEPRTTGALAIAMRRDFPDVEAAVRVWPTPAKVHYDGDVFDFDMVAADVELFNLFDLPFLRGSPATFTDPYFIALTESAARRVFGDDDPIGKSLSIGNVYHGGRVHGNGDSRGCSPSLDSPIRLRHAAIFRSSHVGAMESDPLLSPDLDLRAASR